MAITGETITALVESALEALGASDYAGALSYLRRARLALVAIPDAEHNASRVSYNREDLERLVAEVKSAQSAQALEEHGCGGVQYTTVEYRGAQR